jgi:hypothetical protein
MKHALMSLLGIALVAGISFAHGNQQHILGTVTKIEGNTIMVELATKEGAAEKTATVTVKVVPHTKFIKDGTAVTLKDLKVGDRVVIHALKKGEQLEAQAVRVGASPKAPHY